MSEDRSIVLGAVVVVGLVALAMGAVANDARGRRAERAIEEPVIESALRHLPAPDLALSGGARWLRMPSLEEPTAAFADAPAVADPDPAGGAMSPPRDAWLGISRGPGVP